MLERSLMLKEKRCSLFTEKSPCTWVYYFLNFSIAFHEFLCCACLENMELKPLSGHRKACAHWNALWPKGRCVKLGARRL